MKIFIINPDFGMSNAELEQRSAILKNFVSPDVELYMECLTQNKIEIDSALDVALAAPEIITMAVRAEAEGYDAVVLYCFSDPAVDACRELLHIPVIGGGQAACLLAPFIGRQAGLLLADGARYGEKKLFIDTCGVAPSRIPAIGAIAKHEGSLWENREEVLRNLQSAGQKLIEEQQVQVLILGCLSFLGLEEKLSSLLQVPVISPAISAVSMAEALVRQKLLTSRKAYPTPPLRQRKWQGGML